MPEYPRSPFKKVDDEIKPRVSGDTLEVTPIGQTTPAAADVTDLEVTGAVQADIDMGGNSLSACQSVANLSAQGPSIYFDGVDDFVNLDALAAELVNVNNTEGAIVWKGKIHDFTTALRYPYIFADASGVELIALRIASSNNKLEGKCTVGPTVQWSFVSTNTFDADTEYEIVLTQDGTTPLLYINGKLEPVTFTVETDETKWFADTTAIDNGRVGCSNVNSGGNQNFLNCTVNKFYALNVCPTAAEVLAMYEGGNVSHKWIGANQTNLVVNGGFETDISTPPNQWVNAGNQVGSSVADGTAPEGSNVLEIVSSGVGDNGANNVYSSPTLKTIKGKHYRIQFQAKSISGNASLHAHRHTGAVTLTGDWAEYTQEFVKTESGYTRGAYIWLEGVGVARVDDVRLTQIGCVAQYEQDGICHNQLLDKSGNKFHGVVDGAVPINLSPDHKEQVVEKTVTGDTLWTDVVPIDYKLSQVKLEETAGNAAILDMGTTDGGNDVFTGVNIAASDITIVDIEKAFSSSVTQTLDLNDDQVGSGWNSASVDVTLIMERVM